MATSKHFPVQKYSPRDSEDYIYNETPYNSVSSFKSYHSNQNRNNSDSIAPQYGYENEINSSTPFKQYSRSNVTRSTHQVPYIDDTVVSAYKGSKPPIPSQKLKIPKASASNLQARRTDNVSKINSECQEIKKFGIEQLQSITKRLQNENKELRRHRNSKGHEEVPPVAADSGTSRKDSGKQGESVKEQSLQRETGALSPDNGRHSSMSRRRLPKVPDGTTEPKILPNVIKDTDKVPSVSVKGTAELTNTGTGKDNSEEELRSKVPESVSSENKLGVSAVSGSAESQRNRIRRKLGKHRRRDKERSKSLGDQSGSFTAETVKALIMSSQSVKEIVFDRLDLDRGKNEDVSSANEDIADSEASSQQDYSISSRYSADISTDKSNSDDKMANEMSTFKTPEVVLHGDKGRTLDSENVCGFANTSVKFEGNEDRPPHSKMIDCNQDYSVVDSLNDMVDNAAGKDLFFSFDHEVIQELTDSVMGNGENLEKTKYKKQESNENLMNLDSDVNKSATNVKKQIIEGKSFCLKKCNENTEVPSLNNTRNETNTSNHIEKLNCEVLDKETIDDRLKGNVITTVIPQKTKVERSPSYRKKVMARAKSRYKKSSMLKECSCTKNENGEIVVCQFCENYENRKNRSKSSLGLETVGLVKDVAEVSEGENSEISSYSEISSPRRAFTPGLPPLPSSKSPRPLRKLQVSSRVDVLMSSDLFRKHLHKHENLLQKHTMFRRAGIRKSVSNLDLSEGYVIDSDSQCETESVTSEANFENENLKDDILNQFQDFTQSNNESRRHSLSGESDITEEKSNKSKKKHFRTLPSSVGRYRPPIPSFSQPKSRPNIPTYHEFKVMKELSKSTEALNFENTESENFYSVLDHKNINSEYDKDILKKQENYKTEEKSEVSEQNKNVESVPLQLQVIKESLSRENLLAITNTEPEDIVEINKDLHSDNRRNNFEVKSKQENVPVKQNEGINERNDKIMNDRKADFKSINESRKVSAINKGEDKVDGHEQLIRQQSAPNLKPHHQRVRPKLKSRTLSRLDQDSECLSDTASGVVNKSGSLREHKKHGAKRPRSLISKKSSLMSLIQEAGSRGQNLEDGESSSEKSINSRPKLKVGHNVNRSQSDSKYEMGKAKNMLQDDDESKLSRLLMTVDKGKNSVSFDLEDTSQCSPFDIGESETSTSVAESLSDSIRSEVNVEDYLQHQSDQDDAGKLLHDQDDVVADDSSVLKPLKEELVVLRSTSDACEITQEAARKRRERKERPYKSDPFSGTEIIPASKRCVIREEKAKLRQHMDFANSSKEEILTFLDGVSHGDIAACDSIPSLEELNEDDEQLQLMSEGGNHSSRKLRKHHSNVSSLSTDSGVIGQDGSHDSQQSSPTNTLSHSQSEQTISALQHMSKKRSQSASYADLSSREIQDCSSCGPQDNMLDVRRSQVCAQCLSRRRERREIVQEIVDTEMNYGRDLNILKEEFYKPIMKAGLLNKEQLDAIFLNLDELIHVNKHFITKLKSAILTASQNNDNELEEVKIGCLFLESSTMFLTFENYCVNQAQAPVLLEQLEREKELLRIFLQVSQNDNRQLRRMHLKSFLMVPVQRIMKYPLLLDRLYKTTPVKHVDKASLKEAKEKIEDILGHINAKSRTVSFRQRKPSQKSTQHCSVTEKIEVSRVALETLQWNRKDVCDVITSQLYVTQPVDHTWAVKKCKNYKFTTVYGVLLTLMQQPNETTNDNDINRIRNTHNLCNNENNNSRVKSAAVVFIKEKSGRYQVMREPFMLEKCVVSQDPEYLDVFEILEWSKEAFLIKADTPQETKLWVQNLRQQMNHLGFWRKRRNALPNILLNHLS